MNNKYDLVITPPSSYDNKSTSTEQQEETNLMNEIPNTVNKVIKKVIKGVIKHDTSSNQQE
jgi:hypothetical protein